MHPYWISSEFGDYFSTQDVPTEAV
ncbi:hypothetical protein PCAR4_1140017 [Paraburkholderia caribensis]|nr:hypothetical protein PCAR4_1140017 [Paraburkholderia caribensis]